MLHPGDVSNSVTRFTARQCATKALAFFFSESKLYKTSTVEGSLNRRVTSRWTTTSLSTRSQRSRKIAGLNARKYVRPSVDLSFRKSYWFPFGLDLTDLGLSHFSTELVLDGIWILYWESQEGCIWRGTLYRAIPWLLEMHRQMCMYSTYFPFYPRVCYPDHFLDINDVDGNHELLETNLC
jgi:hypothetical protein